MKEMNDEELQRLLEDKKTSSGELLSDDGKTYQILFTALSKEPETGLPYDFAAKVTRKIAVRQKRSNELKYNMIALIVFLSLIVLVCAILTSYGSITWSDAFRYKWIFLLPPVVFIIIQYLDQKLVKKKLFNNPNN